MVSPVTSIDTLPTKASTGADMEQISVVSLSDDDSMGPVSHVNNASSSYETMSRHLSAVTDIAARYASACQILSAVKVSIVSYFLLVLLSIIHDDIGSLCTCSAVVLRISRLTRWCGAHL